VGNEIRISYINFIFASCKIFYACYYIADDAQLARYDVEDQLCFRWRTASCMAAAITFIRFRVCFLCIRLGHGRNFCASLRERDTDETSARACAPADENIFRRLKAYFTDADQSYCNIISRDLPGWVLAGWDEFFFVNQSIYLSTPIKLQCDVHWYICLAIDR
jgi:hypothetical protein